MQSIPEYQQIYLQITLEAPLRLRGAMGAYPYRAEGRSERRGASPEARMVAASWWARGRPRARRLQRLGGRGGGLGLTTEPTPLPGRVVSMFADFYRFLPIFPDFLGITSSH